MDGPRSINPALLRDLSAEHVLGLSPDIVIVTDLEGLIIYGNAALEERVGESQEALLGRSAVDFIHPEDLPGCEPGWQELLTGECDAWEVALRFGSTATGWRWCLGSVGIDREAGLVIGTHQETSALREAEERFRRAFEDAGIGMAITGVDGRFVRVNRSLADMLGRTPEDLAGVHVMEVTHPDHHAADREGMRALLEGELSVYRTEKRYVRTDGSEAWVSLDVSAVHDADGAPVHFLAQMTDIGGRRAAEEARAESERRFRTLASASPVGIFAVDHDGRLAYANDHLREIFGLSADLLDGPSWLQRIADEDRERVVAEGRRARTLGERTSLDVRVEAGIDRWARVNIAPVGDDADGPTGLVGTVEDVTV